MTKKEPRIRIRARGFSVGQVRKDVISLYEKKNGLVNLAFLAETLIEKDILGHEIKGKADLIQAEAYLNNIGYSNIGEYVENYMKKDVKKSFEVCANCRSYSKGCCVIDGNRYNPYYKCNGNFIIKDANR